MALLDLPEAQSFLEIEGTLSDVEGRRLAFLAAQVPAELAIVEVGAGKGRATAFLAAGSRRGHGARVYAVGLWADERGTVDGSYQEFQQNLTARGLLERVEAVRGPSHWLGMNWQNGIGLLYIATPPRAPACRYDFLIWSRHLVPGGWVALYHYGDPAWTDVTEVVDRFILGSGQWEEAKEYHALYCARKRSP